MNYLFELAGLKIKVECPFEVLIHEESLPFMRIYENEAYEIALHILPAKSSDILKLPKNGKWVENGFFSVVNEKNVLYLCETRQHRPYACCLLDTDAPDQLVCYFDSEKIHCLNHSRNICELIRFEDLLALYYGIYLHASHIRVRGQGILFSAASGVGKSTQANLWIKHKGAELINGDKAAIRRTEEGWYAYGLPYAGSSEVFKNEKSPVKAIVCLEQAPENKIERLRTLAAFQRIFSQTAVHQWDPQFVSRVSDIILKLVGEIPIYLLSCRPDEEAVQLLEETLFD